MADNAKILEGKKCLDCGWPIVGTLNNDGMSEVEPYKHDDYWYYCSNKTCKNHAGEGFSVSWPRPKFITNK